MAERAERASSGWRTCVSPFLPLTHWKECERFFKNRVDVSVLSAGGFEGAERRLLLMGKPELIEAATAEADDAWWDEHIACVEITGSGFKFDSKRHNHRHVLGSILGTGIERDTVGDILVPSVGGGAGGSGIHAFVAAEMSSYLESSLTHIGNVAVKCERIGLDQVVVPDASSLAGSELVTRTCSSSRIDTLVSCCFKISRGKAVEAMKRGEVELNWERCERPGTIVAPGDCITVRGKGRSIISGLEVNQRGRTRVDFSLFS